MRIALALAFVASGIFYSSIALADPPDKDPHVLLSFDDGADGQLKVTIAVTSMAGWESLHFVPVIPSSPGGLPGGGKLTYTNPDPANEWKFTENTISLPSTADNKTNSITFTLVYDKTAVVGLKGQANALKFFPDDQGTYTGGPPYPGILEAPVSGFSKYDYTSLAAVPEPSSPLLLISGLMLGTLCTRSRLLRTVGNVGGMAPGSTT